MLAYRDSPSGSALALGILSARGTPGGRKQLVLALDQRYRTVVEPIPPRLHEWDARPRWKCVCAAGSQRPPLELGGRWRSATTAVPLGLAEDLWMHWWGLSKFIAAVGYPDASAPGLNDRREGVTLAQLLLAPQFCTQLQIVAPTIVKLHHTVIVGDHRDTETVAAQHREKAPWITSGPPEDERDEFQD